MAEVQVRVIGSPLGAVRLAATAEAVVGLHFEGDARIEPFSVPPEPGLSPLLDDLEAQVRAHFAGDRRTFDLPLAPAGTPFQQRVWEELQRISYGQTLSYLDLARRLGDPKATRAVGKANGSNPISLLIPCHRVIRSDGELCGYAGGLWRKEWLLELEGAAPARLAL